ncbi:Voltage-dependent calcium channel subunit alpha-2/delta-3 [Taenia solium]|eukprot:TsM_000896100 transcript=TsM_000896100 gene=TsM_000896100
MSIIIAFKQNQYDREGYQDLIRRGKITLAKLEPLTNVKEYASKLYKLFLRKAEALELDLMATEFLSDSNLNMGKVVQDVEEEAAKYPWNPLLKNISFVPLTDEDENLTRHHYFNIPVNTSQSGVYVPSEVYINDSIIAHQVDWTSNLDHIFQKQNDTLNFIYFASEYGFLRTYPRYQWPLDDKLRALDARRQSWSHVIQNVFRLTAHDAADYDEAIAFGMKLMSTFSAGRPMSAHCNKILVLISDSDIQYNDTTIQILERYQDYVHLFTYSLSTITGPGPLTEVTKQINGAFAQIPVIGALSNILRHFTDHATHYGSTKKLHPQKLDLVVHHAADIFPFKIAEEIGPMASLTMAVYNRTVGLNLLGIMGTDVSAREMVDLLQTYLRKLSAQTIDIDIMDIEASNVTELLTVRENLIDNKEGVTILDDFAVFMDEVHAHRTLRTYSYTPIPETGYSICLVTATDRDLDVQFLSQKEHLHAVTDTVLVDGEDVSSLLLPVNVVLSPILANCRKPSFSRILASPTVTTTTGTTPKPTTMDSVLVEPVDATTLSFLGDPFNLRVVEESTESISTMETETFNTESDKKSWFRRKRNWLTDFFADDPKGVEQVMMILRFIQEYDFGHFMSDLLVGLNVLRAWGSSRMSKNVAARSVFFTSGLGFIYPSHVIKMIPITL